MSIALRPITPENFNAVVQLKVRENQQNFVASNVFSIAQASLYDAWQPQAVYADDTLVGFVLWGIDDDQPQLEWWLIRLMIGAEHQGKGYGRAAAQAAIDAMREKGAEAVYLSFEPENHGAEKLYRSMGFVNTGRVEYDEIVYRLDLAQTSPHR